ncbi:MAG TPA: hypothetical protein VGX28_13700 [Frankiaceae bacterium]|jgi:hypothetical protein|nr:hypothetical protein [Frankiaceae bacterium]
MQIPAQRTVVAFVDSTSSGPVVAAAAERAASEDAALVVFVADAARRFSRVRPTWWSASGQEAQFDGPLTPVQLELLGEHDVAVAVLRARESGVDTYGWLPAQRGAGGVADYARGRRADVVFASAAHAALAAALPLGTVVTA